MGIHLVPRPVENQSANSNSGDQSDINDSSIPTATSPDNGSIMEGAGGSGLLAALLGIGPGNPSSSGDDENNEENEGDSGNLFSLPRTRAARSSSRRRRMNSHRRTASDPAYPEPSSLEPVRQGLMTLHTMIGSERNRCNHQNNDNGEVKQSEKHSSSINAKRKWYRGQWIDCRDTVNQWLEATVVEVVSPADILVTPARSSHIIQCLKPSPVDAAVGANDFTGRLRLLLKQADDETDTALSDLNSNDELIGYRERNKNDGVQLLLIHYNGWPHRWDEWTRSDSERIRPFRTRSKHLPNRSRHACPSPQSVFHAAPSTSIEDDDDSIDRKAILSELYYSVTSISSLFSQSINLESVQDSRSDDNAVLPWKKAMKLPDKNSVEFEGNGGEEVKKEDESDTDPPLNELPSTELENLSKRRLEALAPLLDRLGRVLTDAAPHVAALAENLPSKLRENENSEKVKSNIEEVNNYDEEVDRKKDIEEDSEKDFEEDSEKDHEEDSEKDNEQDNEENSEGNRSLRPSWVNNNDESALTPLLSNDAENSIDCEESIEGDEGNPDHIDFVNGFINVSSHDPRRIRGSSAEGPLNVGDNNTSLGSSLLSYLASGNAGNNDGTIEDGSEQEGPRVLRLTRGSGGGGGGGGGNGIGSGTNNGGGIDIHIHAIVTGPGGGGAGLGGISDLAGILNGTATPISMPSPAPTPIQSVSLLPSGEAEQRSPVTPEDEDDLGLFSDLYSVTPRSIDSTRSDFARFDENDNINDSRNIDREVSSPIISSDENDDDGNNSPIMEDIDHEEISSSAIESPNCNETSSTLQAVEGTTLNATTSDSSNLVSSVITASPTTTSNSGNRSQSLNRHSTILRIFRRALGRR